MFRCSAPPVKPYATLDFGKHKYSAAHCHGSSGQASSSTSTLFRSHSATANLPSLGKNCEAKLLTSQMSSAFQMRNNERLRCFHNAPPVGRRGEDVFRGIYCTIGKKVDKIVDALTSQKYDDLFTRRQGFVEVPRGSLVSEREWASLDTGRRVKFSPRIGATLIPSRSECYPTPMHRATFFFSESEIAEASKRDMSEEGRRGTELNEMQAETRQEATASENEQKARVLATGRRQRPPQLRKHVTDVKMPSFLVSLGTWVSKLQQIFP